MEGGERSQSGEVVACASSQVRCDASAVRCAFKVFVTILT